MLVGCQVQERLFSDERDVDCVYVQRTADSQLPDKAPARDGRSTAFFLKWECRRSIYCEQRIDATIRTKVGTNLLHANHGVQLMSIYMKILSILEVLCLGNIR